MIVFRSGRQIHALFVVFVVVVDVCELLTVQPLYEDSKGVWLRFLHIISLSSTFLETAIEGFAENRRIFACVLFVNQERLLLLAGSDHKSDHLSWRAFKVSFELRDKVVPLLTRN